MAKKQSYRVCNWRDYNRGLVNRGSLTFWFDEESIKNWHSSNKPGRGRPQLYADPAILCMLTLKAVFSLPLRATQGLVASLINLLQLPIKAADYTTLCRRQSKLEVPLPKKRSSKALHVVFDSTGLKVFGEGEWKVRLHGYSKRRTWRKLHLGVDEATGEIVAEVLTGNDRKDGELLPELIEQINRPISQATGDGAYDSFKNYELLRSHGIKATIPPRTDAKIGQHGNTHGIAIARDEVLREVRRLGLGRWKRQNVPLSFKSRQISACLIQLLRFNVSQEQLVWRTDVMRNANDKVSVSDLAAQFQTRDATTPAAATLHGAMGN
jgi:hypothetical protein